ncbi:hypothetical protein QUA35_28940 [Microcoleus sp. N9_B2]|uniref:hypothetical protein n=1 Tax=unclassified Microcoleus TaxID=2642155 RepID=UPI002FCF1840
MSRILLVSIVSVAEGSNEVRCELMRAGKVAGIRKLDLLKILIQYIPISTETMLKAAELWVHSRRARRSTAYPKELDGEVILAAQAISVANEGHEVIIRHKKCGTFVSIY